MDILRNQMLIFRYKALFGLLFAVILNCETASIVEGIRASFDVGIDAHDITLILHQDFFLGL